MIELAKNSGKISLALHNPLDKTLVADDTATTARPGIVPADALFVQPSSGGRRK